MYSLLGVLQFLAALASLVSARTPTSTQGPSVWQQASHYNPCTSAAPLCEPWPQGIIPYSFSDDLSESVRTSVQASIRAVENASCITFVPRRNQQDYLLLQMGDRCCSHKGKVGFGHQIVSISEWCIDSTLTTMLQQVAGITPESNCNDFCREIIQVDVNTNGVISSVNFPESNYPSESNCVYKFWIPPGAKVVFEFQAFHLEYHEDCGYDFLEITEQTESGITTNLTVLCGRLDPSIFESSSRSVSIRFYSDVDAEESGFQLKYKTIFNVNNCSSSNGGCSQICLQNANSTCSCFDGYYLAPDNHTCLDIDECMDNRGGCEQRCRNTDGSYYCHCRPGYGLSSDNHTCTRCGGDLTDTHGEVMSPNHPLPYPHHQFCHWTIQVQPAHALKINITDLDIYANDRCDVDYLKMQHGKFSRKHRLCGSYTTIAYYLQNILTTEFTFRTHTDTAEHSGFKLTYWQVPIDTLSHEELNRVYIDNRTIHYNTNKWT